MLRHGTALWQERSSHHGRMMCNIIFNKYVPAPCERVGRPNCQPVDQPVRECGRRRPPPVRLSLKMPRPDLSNRDLLWAVGIAVAAIAAYAAVRPFLPTEWRVPGSMQLYLTGVVGAAMLLGAAGFLVVKRGGMAASPPRWFSAHVMLACIGTVLIVVHSGGYMRRPPALLLLALAGLAALGIWARLRGAKRMAATMGTKRQVFAAPDPALRKRLAAVIAEKQALLARLDPAASEALFSPHLGHWLRRPFKTLAYRRLVLREEALIGARQSVGAAQAWWRPLHMILAGLFVLGIVVHVVTVTFFAGYVADGGPITWWHLAALGG